MPMCSPPQTAQHAIHVRVSGLRAALTAADPDRSGPAVAIVVDSNVYIVDAGPGVVLEGLGDAEVLLFDLA